MREFPLNGNTYKIGKIVGWDQHHVARKLGPGFVAFASIAQTGMGGVFNVADFFAKLPFEDYEYIMSTSLKQVQRMDHDKPVPVMPAPGRMQYEDIDLQAQVTLAIEVIKESLGNFFPGLLEKVMVKEAAQPKSSPT